MIAQHSSARRRGTTAAAGFLSQFHSPATSPASSTLDLTCESDRMDCSELDTPISKPSSVVPSPEIAPTDEQSKRERSNSWSSVKEDQSDAAQSFLVTLKPKAECVAGQSSFGGSLGRSSCCSCHCQWSSLRQKPRSRSLSLKRSSRSLPFDDDGDTESIQSLGASDSISQAPHLDPPQLSMIEKLPFEVSEAIVAQLALDQPPNAYTPRNRDLVSCLRVSKSFHQATLRVLYQHVSFQHSYSFSKFLSQITAYPALGALVRRLDLSHFSSLGMGRTKQLNLEIQNLTATTLLQCLGLAPGTQEILMQEHLDGDVDQAVLKKIFYGLPRLRALDLCGSSNDFFVQSFSGALRNLERAPQLMLPIQNLSLHECSTIPSADLELLLPRLPHLRILDLHHTRLTDAALASIPHSARLTHLNIGRCTHLDGAATVDFLTTHPAVAAPSALVYLNLHSDPTRHRLLLPPHVAQLLAALPASLRSLNLTGAPITSTERDLLHPLTRHLEELSLGHADLAMKDLAMLLRPASAAAGTASSSGDAHTLRYLDLTGVKVATSAALMASATGLVSPATQPLEVIEVSDKVAQSPGGPKGAAATKRLGWAVRECGRRAWFVRLPAAGAKADGRRAWKMGAQMWGMRKVPVAWGEVGGLYGHYMFKK